MSQKDPTLDVEHACFADGAALVIGVDEVGRGALAGPVAVGVHAVSAGTREFPPGLRDSKLLSEKKRELILPSVETWGSGAVGYASAAEIDERGIMWALGAAGRRALRCLHEAGVPMRRAVILVDGRHDWLSAALRTPLHVRTMVAADRTVAAVAAASVRAKTHRDAIMRAAHRTEPYYGWVTNKGYGTAAHYAGIAAHGLSRLHRKTWAR